MPIIAKKSVEIPAKRYTGTIEKVEIVTSQNEAGSDIQYVNMHTRINEKPVDGFNGLFKLSVPAHLTQQSALGRLLKRLGINYEFGQEFDEQELVGYVIGFDTKRVGSFTNPVMDSVLLVASPSESSDADEDDVSDDDDVADDE